MSACKRYKAMMFLLSDHNIVSHFLFFLSSPCPPTLLKFASELVPLQWVIKDENVHLSKRTYVIAVLKNRPWYAASVYQVSNRNKWDGNTHTHTHRTVVVLLMKCLKSVFYSSNGVLQYTAVRVPSTKNISHLLFWNNI